MFRTAINFFKVKDIRNKILFTLAMLVIYRLGTFLPVPGVNTDILQQQDQLGVFGILNTFGGGALKNFSIFAMGIMPYITASIVVQLLQMDVVPTFTEWSKQGEVGRKKLQQTTRYFAIILALIQSVAMSVGFNNIYGGALLHSTSWHSYALIAIVLTTGTAFLIWLGDLISQYGVGNGISILIFAGIVASIPSALMQVYASQIQGAANVQLVVLKIAIIVLVLLLIVMGVIYIQEAVRKIPIQYAKAQIAGRRGLAPRATFLPLKVNAAGVIPVIFAVAFLTLPRTFTLFWPKVEWIQKVGNWFDYSHPIGMVIYVGMIILFAYFYAFVQVNPEKMADNLRKQGSYIPGIRPGKDTENYITGTLYRLTFVGSIFLAVIAVLPIVFSAAAKLPASVQIGGTSLLIVVGVALETMKQLESQLTQRHYKGFMKK